MKTKRYYHHHTTAQQVIVDVSDLPRLLLLTPPMGQGQCIEVSYAGLCDGRVLRRTYDHSDGTTTYAVADWSDAAPSYESPAGLNCEPSIDGEWRPCTVRGLAE